MCKNNVAHETIQQLLYKAVLIVVVKKRRRISVMYDTPKKITRELTMFLKCALRVPVV